MDSNLSLSEVLHDNWLLHENEGVIVEEAHPIVITDDKSEKSGISTEKEPNFEVRDDEIITIRENPNGQEGSTSYLVSNDKRMLSNSPPYQGTGPDIIFEEKNSNFYHKKNPESPKRPENFAMAQQVLYLPSYATSHGYALSSTYHQPFLPMVRGKKPSALASALQRPAQMPTATPVTYAYVPSYSIGFTPAQTVPRIDPNNNEIIIEGESVEFSQQQQQQHQQQELGSTSFNKKAEAATTTPFTSSGCSQPTTNSTYIRNRYFELPANVLDGANNDESADEQQEEGQNQHERQSPTDERAQNGGDAEHVAVGREESVGLEGEEHEKLIDEKHKDHAQHGGEEMREREATAAAAASGGDADSDKVPKSELEALLMQPVKKVAIPEFQPSIVVFSAVGAQPSAQQQSSSKTMQFYQAPPQQHLARNTPPPGFAQPYGMGGIRPHEEETRQIMNLDNQQTHSSSPTSSWNQPYPQMTNLNAYQQRGPGLYAPPASMVHQNGPVVPNSNPYYQPPQGPPIHHMQPPQAPMMAPGMHGQQQQPYYNTQSPLTGTPPSMNYGTPGMPAPPDTNGNGPIFNFSKPRPSNEGSSSTSGTLQRRKKHNDLSSPRYNSHGNDDVDASSFPDMSDFPLLDVVQSKAKKDAGRKPCRPHLCEQSRMLISRVCHFQREFIKRLPPRHPLANSPFSKPDQWTSQIMGISLATVRKCVDMATDEEVFTRCTDKNLVNLTPSERAEREELLSKLSTVFEDEKSLGAGTAGLTIAEYSPRRSYSNTLLRQSTDDKSSNSSYAANGNEYGSAETTLLNLDDHSNSSKDFATPTPTMELSANGGHVFEEIGAMSRHEEDFTPLIPKADTPKRGRPRKAAGTPATTSKQNNRRKESNEDSEVSEDKNDEHEKKTEDEDETNEETEKKTEEVVSQAILVEREDDAASSEGTNRSETATPEPTALASPKKTRSTRRKKRSNAGIDEDYSAATKKKRGSVTAATAGIGPDDENAEHKMVTRARSRQP
uniref:Uncharacterized protein n=1 Tax=Caenorhabditis japonica TaxID=281687 RepID=A0A8R1HNH5_CAEJA